MRVSKEQIAEWKNNPVTEALRALAKEEQKAVEATPVTECYIRGNPAQTQDNLAELNTRAVMWDLLCELLEGDWSYLEEEDSEE